MKLWRQTANPARERFDREILPHLDSAYNLARWLVHHEDDAADIVQDACLKAFKNIDQCVGYSRPWFLCIVRNTAYTFLTRKKGVSTAAFLDNEAEVFAWDGPSPDEELFAKVDREMVTRFIEELPPEFREVIILRDLEDLSYKEIAEVTNVPIGTVMSRLNRARQRLQQRLVDTTPEEKKLGL